MLGLVAIMLILGKERKGREMRDFLGLIPLEALWFWVFSAFMKDYPKIKSLC